MKLIKKMVAGAALAGAALNPALAATPGLSPAPATFVTPDPGLHSKPRLCPVLGHPKVVWQPCPVVTPPKPQPCPEIRVRSCPPKMGICPPIVSPPCTVVVSPKPLPCPVIVPRLCPEPKPWPKPLPKPGL